MSLKPFMHSEMSPNDSLHYAIGLIAYCMAAADGKVQLQERQKLKSIVDAELRCKDDAFEVTDIVFQMMDKKHIDRESTYNWALHEIKNNSHYLSPVIKATFLSVISKMATAFPPVTPEEKVLYEKFAAEIEPLNGDPIYYSK
ncbi:MAG: hypothetical protein WCR21_02935 [Bacteroidota bacterium]